MSNLETDSPADTTSLRSFDVEGSNKGEKLRREFLERQTGVPLNALMGTRVSADTVVGRNIENVIGSTEVPLGVAGPVIVSGEYANGVHYIPCATTEAALIASISRGCKVISQAGGVKTRVTYNGMSRAPLFIVEDPALQKQISKDLVSLTGTFQKLASETSSHITFLSAETYSLGAYMWIRLVYDTDQAMGMNMTTIASETICNYIESTYSGCKLLALSGNMCIDKKANWLNVIKGRGYDVTAECIIPKSILKNTLKTTAATFAQVSQAKNWYGSAMGGAMAFNAQVANVIAAVFLATGQDIGHVIESSQAFTVVEQRGEDIYMAVKLPTLLVGTIGGGTGLPSQKAALDLLLQDTNNIGSTYEQPAYAFAEIIAAAVLAGEMSLLGALSTHHLATAHLEHARKHTKK